ncbi:hypothetical protein PHLCEN_2v9094, partial [Hermanssonia centrifuga]
MSFTLHPDLRVKAAIRFHSNVDVVAFWRMNEEQQRIVLTGLGLLDLVGLALFLPEGYRLATDVIAQSWSVELAGITNNVDDFLNAMRSTGTCLSGGKCLSMLDRHSDWQTSDWDFYCPREGFDAFCLFILDKLHGVTVEHRVGSLEGYGDITVACESRRITTPHAVFDIICSASSSALLPLTYFHSTLVMNFITADFLCIAYPWGLDARHGVIQTYASTTKSNAAIEKYRGRGYVMYSSWKDLYVPVDGNCTPHRHCPRAVRHFGDDDCLTIRFHVPGYMKDNTPRQEDLTGMKWSVAWVWGGHECSNADCVLRVSHFAHTILVKST